jgi:hypothetical protein
VTAPTAPVSCILPAGTDWFAFELSQAVAALWLTARQRGTLASMSETNANRDRKGRFITGNSGGGRPRGARSKLGEAFLEDLRNCWEERGAEALRRCAEEEPAQFCKIVASLMPRDLDLPNL